MVHVSGRMLLIMALCMYIGAIAVGGSEFSSTSNPVVISAVNCSGMESSLSDCTIETFRTCAGEVAGIICQGEEREFIAWGEIGDRF